MLVFTSCRDSFRDNDRDTSSAKSYAISEHYFSDPYLWVNKLLVNPMPTKDTMIYLDSAEECINNIQITPYPKLGYTDLTISFDENATCFDGRVRKGEINARVWGSYKTTGTRLSIKSNVYFINDFRVIVNDSLENLGRDADSGLVFSSRIRNGVIDGDSIYVEWDANHEYTWASGEKTLVYHDDEFSISGNVRSRTFNGNTISADIIEPLLRDLGCFWITAGTVEMKPENLLVRYLDFGDGKYCENDFDVTISQSKQTIAIDDAGY